MQLKQFLDDDRAVSPVIGVILMVAITVILAAVIGTFVLGLGDQVSQTTPQASFSFDYDRDTTAPIQDELTVSHNGGDTLEASEVSITISGASPDPGNVNSSTPWGNFSGTGDEVSAGSSVVISNSSVSTNNELDLSGATVRVVWQAAEGDSSAQLGTWNGPDA
jgi:flagellin-like protein